MLLKNLIRFIPNDKKNIIISGISVNSKEVKKNNIFFAIKGNKINGEKYIYEAIKRGARVVICSKNCNFTSKNILVIKSNNIRFFLSEICSKFYSHKPKNIIAVTGTNGKTSVADIFYQLLNINNIPVASIGTFGIKYRNKIIKTNLTSPDTINLHKYLNHLKKKNIDNVIIEASSHGLDQKRLHHIKFKAGIFTNFSQDHLDYHKNMKSYLNSKLILFRRILHKNSVVISDKKIKPYKFLDKIAQKNNLKLLDIEKEFNKIKKMAQNITSDFKIKNMAMAILSAKLCGLKKSSIFSSLKKIKDVNGRLELVREFKNNVKVYVDYAHTPDALLKAIESLKKDFGNNITLVFGCGGDRDKKKRYLMAKIANDNCKKIYITDDNPRNENPKQIRNQLAKHISNKKYFNIGERSLAIKKAIQEACPLDIILIAGKGHEEKQIYKNKIYNISDKKIVKKLKIKLKKLSEKQQNYFQNKVILKKIFNKLKSLKVNGLSIDTRTLKKNNLFIALKGTKIDGNEFIKEAFKKGAGGVISSSVIKAYENKIIKTQNPIKFLNNFGRLKREYSNAKIIAVTGSAGKTSLKNLIKDLLQNFGKTHHSPRSFNNHFGVPVSLSNLSYNDKFGVFEVGMSNLDEIRKLTRLLKPHVGVITNIGEAHIENFKNIQGIAKAKSEIIENIEPGGRIILNRDDKFFNYLFKKAKLYKLKVLSFGKHVKSDIRLIKIEKKGIFSKIFINVNNQITSFKSKDLNIYNILASLSVLKALEIDFLKIISKFQNLEPSDGRGKKYLISRYNKRFKLIDESYNANPLSVKTAIDKLKLIKKTNLKKYLILGDMLELGSHSKKYHEELSKVINNSDIDKVFVKGKKIIFTYKYLKKEKRGNILHNIGDIDLSLREIINNNDYLMIKGSNATGLNNFSKKMIRGI